MTDPLTIEPSNITIDNTRRDYYIDLVEELSEFLRSKFIVINAGQIMEYEVKAEEASRYWAMTEPERLVAPQGTFPFAEDQAEEENIPISDIMSEIINARAKWETAGKKIATGRQKAKKAINNATTEQEMLDAYTTLQSVENEINTILNT